MAVQAHPLLSTPPGPPLHPVFKDFMVTLVHLTDLICRAENEDVKDKMQAHLAYVHHKISTKPTSNLPSSSAPLTVTADRPVSLFQDHQTVVPPTGFAAPSASTENRRSRTRSPSRSRALLETSPASSSYNHETAPYRSRKRRRALSDDGSWRQDQSAPDSPTPPPKSSNRTPEPKQPIDLSPQVSFSAVQSAKEQLKAKIVQLQPTVMHRKKVKVKPFSPKDADAIATYFAQLASPETCERLEKLVDYITHDKGDRRSNQAAAAVARQEDVSAVRNVCDSYHRATSDRARAPGLVQQIRCYIGKCDLTLDWRVILDDISAYKEWKDKYVQWQQDQRAAGLPVSRAVSPASSQSTMASPDGSPTKSTQAEALQEMDTSILFNAAPADLANGAPANPKPYIAALMAQSGKGRGHNILSRVTKAFCKKMNITNADGQPATEKFKNKLQECKPFYELTLELGRGIIALLPLGSIETLRRWNLGRIVQVYPILTECFDWLPKLCEIVEQSILLPITQGTPTWLVLRPDATTFTERIGHPLEQPLSHIHPTTGRVLGEVSTPATPAALSRSPSPPPSQPPSHRHEAATVAHPPSLASRHPIASQAALANQSTSPAARPASAIVRKSPRSQGHPSPGAPGLRDTGDMIDNMIGSRTRPRLAANQQPSRRARPYGLLKTQSQPQHARLTAMLASV